MNTHLATPKGWKHPNQSLAKKEFKRRLKKEVEPKLFLHTYRGTNFKCLSWECDGNTEGETYTISAESILNNALLFWDEKECIPLHEGSFFQMNGNFFIIENDKKDGLSVKQIDMICTQEMISTFCNHFDIQGFEYILCKAFLVEPTGMTFIGYVWSGYKEDEDVNYRNVLPLFTKDFCRMYTDTNFWDWHYIPLKVGETIRQGNKIFIVKENSQGTYVDEFATIILNKNRKLL